MQKRESGNMQHIGKCGTQHKTQTAKAGYQNLTCTWGFRVPRNAEVATFSTVSKEVYFNKIENIFALYAMLWDVTSIYLKNNDE